MGKTYVNILLDESGSMDLVRSSVIEGFNEYIDGLKETDHAKNIRVSLTKFDTAGFNPEYIGAKLKKVPKLNYDNYIPSAGTPLFDAVGRMVRGVEQQIAEGTIKQGDDILVVIQTDGEENASREYRQNDIAKLVKEKSSKGWTFVYLGQNQDAWKGASTLGVSMSNTIAYKAEDVRGILRSSLVSATTAYAAGTAGSHSNFFNKVAATANLTPEDAYTPTASPDKVS